MAKFRPPFHNMLVNDFVEGTYYGRKNLYYFIGKIDPWKEYIDHEVVQQQCDCSCPNCANKNGTLITVEYGDHTSPHQEPDNADFNDITIRDNIVYMNKIGSGDISAVIPKNQWTSGTQYTQWDNTIDLTNLSSDRPFYVVNSENNVYKCISNNNYVVKDGKMQNNAIIPPSTIEPTGISYDVIKTKDNYIWKYLYTIPRTKITKFVNSNFIPVQTSVDLSFYNNGAIEQVIVNDAGNGYSSNPMTTAVVSAPELSEDQGGRTAKVLLFVDRESGTIVGTEIIDKGFGYEKDPTITVTSANKEGVGKYSGNHTAVLYAHVKDQCLDSVSIHDGGINYPADNVTILVVDGDGEGCQVYPKIVDGQIVGVVVTDPGHGYTYATIKAQCVEGYKPIQEAIFTCKIGGSIVVNDQSVVEQLATPGEIYAIQMTNCGGGYTSNVKVVVEGDGEGFEGHCELVEGGKINRVIVDNPGKYYTSAVVKFIDLDRIEPNPQPIAEGYAILPPARGHGFNAIQELYSKTISIYTNIDSNTTLRSVSQEFRQFGLIEGLRNITSNSIVATNDINVLFELQLDKLISDTPSLVNDSIVYINNVPHRVVTTDGYNISLQQFSSIYRKISIDDVLIFNDNKTKKTHTFNIVDVIKSPNVNKHSGSLIYVANVSPFYFEDNKTIAMRSYITL